jgi:creatinine amidohydrolase/Fe(II)-dependent formamide hydrolase-like protein
MKLLEEMNWPGIEAGLERTQTVILPVGATEEHGLPAGQDLAVFGSQGSSPMKRELKLT